MVYRFFGAMEIFNKISSGSLIFKNGGSWLDNSKPISMLPSIFKMLARLQEFPGKPIFPYFISKRNGARSLLKASSTKDIITAHGQCYHQAGSHLGTTCTSADPEDERPTCNVSPCAGLASWTIQKNIKKGT